MAHEVIYRLDFERPWISRPLWRALNTIVQSGHLKVRDWKGETREFGDKTGRTVAIHFKDSRTQRALLADPQLAIAEGYMDGEIEIESGSIYDVLELLARNMRQHDLPAFMKLSDKFRILTRLARQ